MDEPNFVMTSRLMTFLCVEIIGGCAVYAYFHFPDNEVIDLCMN